VRAAAISCMKVRTLTENILSSSRQSATFPASKARPVEKAAQG